MSKVTRGRRANLDFPVQQNPDLGHPTGQVEVARRTMTYATLPLLYQLQLLFLQMHRMRKNRVASQEVVVIIHPGVRDWFSWLRKMRKQLLRALDL